MSRRPAAAAAVRMLRRAPRLKRDAIVDYQTRLLRRLLAHAATRVPAYRRRFEEHGVRLDQIRTLDDLARLPLTGKTELRDAPPRELVADGFDPDALITRTTSGSGGQPLTIRRTWLEQNLLHLFRIRAQRSVGLRPTDRVASIGIVRGTHERDNKLLGRALRAAGLHRKSRLDIFRDPADILADLDTLRPDVVTGYPGVVAAVADLNARRPEPLRPRMLMCGGEALALPLRTRIESGFGASVFNMLGTHEVNLVAWQCRETGLLHTCDDSLVVEVLCDGRPAAAGEAGELVITSLHSYAMPFIRYRLGDVVVRGPETCPCGAPFGTFTEIRGRIFEFFPLPDGRVMHAHELGTKLVIAGPWIRQFQIVQECPERIRLRVVADDPDAADVPAVERRARELLGPGVRMDVDLVDRIPPEANGKHRMYRSLVGDEPSPT